jgi:hypothetical protein
MFSPSNLYAERVFAEHPLDLWALDDSTDYVSLITEDGHRDIFDWTLTKGTTSVDANKEELVEGRNENYPPFLNSHITKVTVTPTASFTGTKTMKLHSGAKVFSSAKDFSLGVSIYVDPFVNGVRIGYQIGSDTAVMSPTQYVPTFSWSPISATFGTAVENASLVIEVDYIYKGLSDQFVYINGLSAGIFAEEFSGSSLGIIKESKPSGFPVSGTFSVYPAKSYGFSDNSGYYIIDGDTLRARNSSIPMVFGASNSTILSKASDGKPSLIIPGDGFLHESGKYFSKSLEFWIRLNSFASTPKRIVGPLGSTDGLYAHGPFLVLKVGSNIASHYVGEWSRPMIVQMTYQESSASLVINGESIVSVDVDLATTELSSGEDWIGFFCHDDVPSMEIDCVAIYPYVVSPKLSKRRFVYGQGVELPASTNTAYGGSSMVVDYTFANYTKNYSFPKNSYWISGDVDNLYADSNRLSVPKYSLPDINLGNKSKDAWLVEQESVQSDSTLTDIHRAALQMFPYSTPEQNPDAPYFLFQKLTYIPSPSGFYGVFEIIDDTTVSQTLFKLENIYSGDYLSVERNDRTITYYLNGVSSLTFDIDPLDTRFCVGVNFNRLREYSDELFDLLSSSSDLRMFVAGTGEVGKTFDGKVIEFGLFSQSNTNDSVLSGTNVFQESGFINDPTLHTDLMSSTFAYTVIATDILGSVKLDLKVKGIWSDILPLSYLKQDITTEVDGNIQIEPRISSIQLNIDYPELTVFSDGKYDTSESLLRSYVSFQKTTDGAILDSARTVVRLPDNAVIVPENPLTETYEFVDGAILKMPDLSGLDITIDDLLLVFTVVFDIDGTTLNPVSCRYLDIASITFGDNELRGIGTRYGTQIYPFKETQESVYESSGESSMRIYKGSTPYLYLSSKTGISVVGEIDDSIHQGILIKPNETQADLYNVSSILLAMRHNSLQFPESKSKLFEIEGKILKAGQPVDVYMRFSVQATNTERTRGNIVCETRNEDGTFSEYNKIKYFWNGNIVAKPEITVNEWGMLAIAFQEFLDFSKIEGRIEILGNLLIDNLSVYKISETTSAASVSVKNWNSAKYDINLEEQQWADIQDPNDTPLDPTDDSTWFDAYASVLSSNKPIDQTDIYRTYIGTNKIIIDSSETESSPKQLRFQNCEYIVFNAVEWKTNILNAI